MAADSRKRQKKLERSKARRKSKRREFLQEKNAGVAERLSAAAGCPILHCWAATSLWTQGLGSVGLSRTLADGSVAFAIFLVDRYCLGVKNAWADTVSRSTYNERIVLKMRPPSTTRKLDPADARKIVEIAVVYANSLGFQPHSDYQRAKYIFGSIDVAQSTEELEFGKDNKPYFIAGPNDTPQRCRRILNTLQASCGPGGFDYLVGFSASDDVFPISHNRQSPRMIDIDETETSLEQEVKPVEG